MGGKHWELRLESWLTVKKYLWPRLIIPARKDLFLLSRRPFSLALISSYFLHSLVPVVFVAGDCGPLAFLTPWGSVCLVISSDCLATTALFNVNCVWAATYFFFLMVQEDILVELNFTLKMTLHSTVLENIFHWTIFWASYLYYGLKTIKKGPLPPWEEDVALFSDENERREHSPPTPVGLVLFQLRVLVVTV